MTISAPNIGLLAPVLPGVTDSQLDVGVGHLPSSSWPDLGGTTVLEAHDVTFFSRVGQLTPGQLVQVDAPCRQWVYQVTAGHIVPAGSPVTSAPTPTLVLVTCWPTNALYLTHYRYVLTAELVKTRNTDIQALQQIPATVVPTAAVPNGLTPGEVTPDAIRMPEGTLSVIGALQPASTASAQILAAAANAFTVFDVGILAAEDGNTTWWRHETDPAHPVALSQTWPLRGTRPEWRGAVNIALHGTVNVIDGAELTGRMQAEAHEYQFDVTLTNLNGQFVINSWRMARSS